MVEKIPASPFRLKFEEAEIPDLQADPKAQERIFQLEQDPDTIVRVSKPSFTALEQGLPEVVGRAKTEFVSLRERYGIPVSADYVIANDEAGQPVVYGVTDRVYQSDTAEAVRQGEVAEVVHGLLLYYCHKLQTLQTDSYKTEPFLNDIGLRKQYVYGHTAKDDVDRLHLVDIDYEHQADEVGSIVRVIAELCAEEKGMLYHHVTWAKREGQSLGRIRQPLQSLLQSLEKITKQDPARSGTTAVAALRSRLEQLFSD